MKKLVSSFLLLICICAAGKPDYLPAYPSGPDRLSPGCFPAEAPKQAWAIAGDDIKTRWAAQVDPSSPLPEYPRPQMVRSAWMNLNGLWDYSIGEADNNTCEVQGRILVPFAVESALSGVGKSLGKDNALWYRRTFTVPRSWKGKTVLLNFGAVDWKSEVWINRQKAAEHTGGYAPFSIDITPFLKKSGKQEVIVKVQDATDQCWQPRGKQVASPQSIWYTPVSGIWQTVWLEPVSAQAHVRSYHAIADVDNSAVSVKVEADGLAAGDVVTVALKEGGKGYSAEKPSASIIARAEGLEVLLHIADAKLWSPDSPWLYGLEISITRKGKVLDKVEGYTALREFSRIETHESLATSRKVRRGYQRIGLNGAPLFQFGPLDQGWWPDGLYTAPTDEALRFDIEKTREWGFNMIRKHIKVEPARWYYWCDVLGMIVWQDMPSIGDHSKRVNATRPEELAKAQMNKWSSDSFIGGTDCVVPKEWKDNYYKEWGEIIQALKGFPCIAVWVPFNEAWGQFDTEEAVAFTRRADPGRLVNESSGGNYHFAGDILDAHHYPEPMMNVFEKSMINVLGEYGGIGYVVEGHIWRPSGGNWGYAGLCQSPAEVLRRYTLFADRLKTFISTGCAAAVYTQTTDVELEVNGLMTYDRLEKVDAAVLREINQGVINAPFWEASL